MGYNRDGNRRRGHRDHRWAKASRFTARNSGRAMLPGDTVRLVVPENPRLHGAVGVITALASEGWGGYVSCPAAGTGTFRALYDEMALEKEGNYLSERVTNADATRYQDDTDSTGGTVSATGPGERPIYGAATGDVCSCCGGVNMVRSGACTACSDCGTSGGCS